MSRTKKSPLSARRVYEHISGTTYFSFRFVVANVVLQFLFLFCNYDLLDGLFRAQNKHMVIFKGTSIMNLKVVPLHTSATVVEINEFLRGLYLKNSRRISGYYQ